MSFKSRIYTLFITAGLGAGVLIPLQASAGLEDSFENRLRRADQYQNGFTKEERQKRFDLIIEEFEQLIPEEDRKIFHEKVLTALSLDKVEEIAERLMAQYFTTAEIQALIEFESSPEGRSFLSKMPFFIADFFEEVFEELLSELIEYEEGEDGFWDEDFE